MDTQSIKDRQRAQVDSGNFLDRVGKPSAESTPKNAFISAPISRKISEGTNSNGSSEIQEIRQEVSHPLQVEEKNTFESFRNKMFEKSNIEVIDNDEPQDEPSEKEKLSLEILSKINKGLGKANENGDEKKPQNKGRTERPQVIKFDKKKITLVPNLGTNVAPHCPPKIKTKNLKLVKNPSSVVAVKNLFYGHTEENEGSSRPVPERAMPEPGLFKNKSQGLGIQTINAQKREASDYYPAQTSNEWKVPNKMQTISGGGQPEAKFSKNNKARTNRNPGGFYKEVVPIQKDAKDDDSDWDDDDDEEIPDDQAQVSYVADPSLQELKKKLLKGYKVSSEQRQKEKEKNQEQLLSFVSNWDDDEDGEENTAQRL